MTADNILLYCDYTNLLSYYDDWIDAFQSNKIISFTPIDIFSGLTDDLKLIISKATNIILHHSVTGDTNKHLEALSSTLQSRQGNLLVFVGNEVNITAVSISKRLQLLAEIAPEYIFTQLLEQVGIWLYECCVTTKVISVPHALNPNVYCYDKDVTRRAVDIGVRSARYGITIGDRDRIDLFSYFIGNDYGLNTDIVISNAEHKRFPRSLWSEFLKSCQFTLATETGSFYLARDDELITKVADYIRGNGRAINISGLPAPIAKILDILPNYIRYYLKNLVKPIVAMKHDVDEVDADICDLILDKFYSQDRLCPFYSKAVSSRHFDAIGCKTVQIMFPGRYNDILFAGEHFIELKRDFSNIDEVLSFVGDLAKITKMVNHTYDYVMHNHTHQVRVNSIIEVAL